MSVLGSRSEILLTSLYYSEGRTMNELSSFVDFSRGIIYSELRKLLSQGFVYRSRSTRFDERLGRRIHFFIYFLTDKASSFVQSLSHHDTGPTWAFAF